MKRLATLGAVLLFASPAAAQLVAPAPINPNAPGAPNAPAAYSPTQQQLNESEQKSSGRGLEYIYFAAEGGFSYMNLGGDSSLGLKRTDGPGGMFGVAAGVRLLVLTIGARFRYNLVGAFDMGQINAVVGLHIPVGAWDPYVAVQGGYDFAGALGAGAVDVLKGDDPGNVALRGGNVGVSGGVDYYFVKFFSVGIDATVDALLLTRPKLDVPAGNTDPSVATNVLYQQSGSSVGIGIGASLHAALHF